MVAVDNRYSGASDALVSSLTARERKQQGSCCARGEDKEGAQGGKPGRGGGLEARDGCEAGGGGEGGTRGERDQLSPVAICSMLKKDLEKLPKKTGLSSA